MKHKRTSASWFETTYGIVGLLVIIGMFSYFGAHGILHRELPIGGHGIRPLTLHGAGAVVGGASFICVAATAVILLFCPRDRSGKRWARSIVTILMLAFVALFIWACFLDSDMPSKSHSSLLRLLFAAFNDLQT